MDGRLPESRLPGWRAGTYQIGAPRSTRPGLLRSASTRHTLVPQRARSSARCASARIFVVAFSGRVNILYMRDGGAYSRRASRARTWRALCGNDS